MMRLYVLLLLALVLSAHAEDNIPTNLTPEQTTKARLDALDVLIKRSQYPQAYALADRMVEEFEGEAKFDFQYGLAAVETQHYDEALFAFERLVMRFPNEPRYRLELARTHFYLNNLVRAEIEFKKVLAQNPPVPVKKNVERFLQSIADLQRQVQPKFLFAIDVAGGYDTNINSATDEDSLKLVIGDVPFNVDLDPSAQETASSYWSTLLNFGYVLPLSKTSAFDTRVLYNKRANAETPIYDLDTLMAEAGYGFYTGAMKWRGGGRYQFVQLNGENFLTTMGVSGSGQWLFSGGANLGFFINYGLTSYDANANGDLTQAQLNLTYASAPKRHSWNFSFLFGTDAADDSSNKFNGKSYQGVNYLSTTLWGQRGSRYWLMTLLSSEYDDVNPTFGAVRKDVTFTYGVGWRYAFTTHFSVRNDYSFTYQDSEFEANTYDRFRAELGVTYSF